MKIVIITNYWRDSPGGGVKIFVTSLVDHLIERDLDVGVIFRQGQDHTYWKGPKNKILFALFSFFKLLWIKPNVIHVMQAWYCLLPAVIYKKLFKCLIIETFLSEPTGKSPHIFLKFFQCLLDTCDYIIIGYDGFKDKMLQVDGIILNNTILIREAISVQQVSSDDLKRFKEQFKIPNNAIVILIQGFTANMLKKEGVKIVLEAVRSLINRYPNIQVIITRESQFSNELKSYAQERGLENNTIFTGDLSNPFVPLELCDIFIFPWTGTFAFGLALIEAMFAGKPIIMTSSGGKSEVIIDGVNGLLIYPNVEKMREKLEFLISNPDYAKKLGDAAKISAEDCFSWNMFIERHLKIYQQYSQKQSLSFDDISN
jgi:glycosyltransferase involved in cell wall biosynthesis